ncbi:MAG TPA: hypothetical protein VGM98_24705, partial [Schlesneria sp.]
MFKFSADFDGLVAEAERLQAQMPIVKRQALTAIGYRLVALEKQHFLQLTETGSSNGVTWPDQSPATLARRKTLQRRGLLANADPEDVGRQSGRLSRSFRFVVKNDSVHLTNTDPKAGYFAGRRPLYPQSMPDDWQAKSEQILQSKLNRIT